MAALGKKRIVLEEAARGVHAALPCRADIPVCRLLRRYSRNRGARKPR
jgi:hypothetical protein